MGARPILLSLPACRFVFGDPHSSQRQGSFWESQMQNGRSGPNHLDPGSCLGGREDRAESSPGTEAELHVGFHWPQQNGNRDRRQPANRRPRLRAGPPASAQGRLRACATHASKEGHGD